MSGHHLRLKDCSRDNRLGGDIGSRARPVLDDKLLTETLRQLLLRGIPRKLGPGEYNPLLQRQCQVCNKTFTTTRKDAQYCSSKCRLRAFRNEGGGAP